MKPTSCGKRGVHIPDAGCDDCTAMEMRIRDLEHDVESLEERMTVVEETLSDLQPMSEGTIIDLTPFECYIPPCASSEVCVGEACCMIVSCDDGESGETSEITPIEVLE